MKPEKLSQFPRNPKQAFQWLSSKEDFQKLDEASKIAPVFAAAPSAEEQKRIAELKKLPRHNPEFLQSRQKSIEQFRLQVGQGQRRQGPNQHILEYKNRIAHRLEFLRTKRHSLAHEYYSPNKDIAL